MDKSSKEAFIKARNQRDLKMLIHEKIHEENRENAFTVEGGYVATLENDPKNVVQGWVQQVEDRRRQLALGKEKAMGMWQMSRNKRK